MAASGSVFSQTLQEITNTKLEELSKRRNAYEQEKAAVLASVQQKTDPIERLAALSAAVSKCFRIHLTGVTAAAGSTSHHPALEIELKNLNRFLAQARYDPSVSAKTLDKWEKSLLHHLDSQSLKFEYASLYAQLVMEWLSSQTSKGKPDAAADDVDMHEDFEHVDTARKLQSRIEWEKVVFEPAAMDNERLMKYLDGLFGVGDPQRKPLFRVLVRLREEVAAFERGFQTAKQFTPQSLRWVIAGLVRSNLLTDDQREVLKDFLNNDIILNEVADVLNMRMAALGSWSWGASVSLDQRRTINGAFSIHMREDLLQAIFLHYIGVRLSVFLKGAFCRFRDSRDAWLSNARDISADEKSRMEYYLGPLGRRGSLQSLRRREYRKHYFMSQLVRSEHQPVEATEGDEEADYAQATAQARAQQQMQMQQQQQQQQAQMPPQQAPMALQNHQMQLMLLEQQNKKRLNMARNEQGMAAQPAHKKRKQFSAYNPHRNNNPDGDSEDDEDDDDDDDDDSSDPDDPMQPRNPMATKKRLLHLLSTEMALGTALHGGLTAFHATLDRFYSTFPHQTIEIVMVLFGFSATWRSFFKAFLEAPLRFQDDDDDDNAEPRVRKRGTPGSHAISEVFGEATLFVLDFAVNRATGGQFLWRMHDDFWFWSVDEGVCGRAWGAVRAFVEATGLGINGAKTGTARVVGGKKTKEVSRTTAKGDESRLPPLPEGEIRWGFLRLSEEEGRFVIDQAMVDDHIRELRRQLKERDHSVFDFVQTWNAYAATFFTSNFGKPANCFGRAHVDEMLATHERIQREMFEGGGSIVEHLKRTLEGRFGVRDVPDGYLFFPVELGGLDLQSPFVSLLQFRDSLLEGPAPVLAKLEESEAQGYARAKRAFESGAIRAARRDVADPSWRPGQKERETTFVTFDEFVLYREEWDFGYGWQVRDAYRRLLEEPEKVGVEGPGVFVNGAIAPLAGQPGLRCITGYWAAMEPYWKWVAVLHGPEIQERFGGLNIVDPDVLPMGMVKLFREKRVNWQA